MTIVPTNVYARPHCCDVHCAAHEKRSDRDSFGLLSSTSVHPSGDDDQKLKLSSVTEPEERRWMLQAGCEPWVWNATRQPSARTRSALKTCATSLPRILRDLGWPPSAIGVGFWWPSPICGGKLRPYRWPDRPTMPRR